MCRGVPMNEIRLHQRQQSFGHDQPTFCWARTIICSKVEGVLMREKICLVVKHTSWNVIVIVFTQFECCRGQFV